MDLSMLTDYVKNGKVEQGRQIRTVMVTGESDLFELDDYGYEPGTIAYTAGFTDMWQKDDGGDWISLMTGEAAEEPVG